MIRIALILCGLFALFLQHYVLPVSDQLQFIIFISGILLLGVPHGAADMLVANKSADDHKKPFTKRRFHLRYLGLLVAFAIILYFFPLAGNLLFILFAAYHFGETDLYQFKTNTFSGKLLVISYGLLLLCTILIHHFEEVKLSSQLSGFSAHHPGIIKWIAHHHGIILSFFGLLFCLSTWIYISINEVQWQIHVKFLIQFCFILFIVYNLPMLLGFTFYFIIWHSLLSLQNIINYLRKDGGRSVVLIGKQIGLYSLISIAGICLFGMMGMMFVNNNSLLMYTFLGLAVLTAPHMEIMHSMYSAIRLHSNKYQIAEKGIQTGKITGKFNNYVSIKKFFVLLAIVFLSEIGCQAQSIGFNSTGASPDPKAMVDIASTKSGLLIPRMTTVQRDSIVSPPNSLQIFNLTTNTVEIYRNNAWTPFTLGNALNNLVNVYSLSDLPAPVSGAITLNANKMYVFSGIVDISPNYLNLNGAGLRGTDPGKDGVMSSVSGGILRSTGVSVFTENFCIIPLSSNTKAYDLADATGTKYCNLFSGSSVVEAGTPSGGVGQISGFKCTTIEKNYWNCATGIKITGTVGKFAAMLNYIIGITSGAAMEFLPGLTIDDIDLSNNYFIYTGQTGVKVDAGSVINRGRMTVNMFRGVTTYLSGFDSYTPAWEMRQNTYIPNTRAFGSLYMNLNTTTTSLPVINTFYKIAGTTTAGKEQRFSASSNRLTYLGKDSITAKVLVILGAYAPNDNSSFSITIAKNGVAIANPTGSMAPSANNQSFQITLATEVDLGTNDYLEVFIRTNNSNSSSIKVDDLQFRVTD